MGSTVDPPNSLKWIRFSPPAMRSDAPGRLRVVHHRRPLPRAQPLVDPPAQPSLRRPRRSACSPNSPASPEALIGLAQLRAHGLDPPYGPRSPLQAPPRAFKFRLLPAIAIESRPSSTADFAHLCRPDCVLGSAPDDRRGRPAPDLVPTPASFSCDSDRQDDYPALYQVQDVK